MTAAGGSDVIVEAVKRAHGVSESEGQRQLAAVQIEVVEGTGRAEDNLQLSIPREARRNHVWVDYMAKVPASTRLTVKSVSGSATVKGMKGDVHVESVSGDVDVDATSRMAIIKSVSGNIQIVSAGSNGDLTASSVSGSVTATNVKAQAIDLGTVSGEVVLTGVTCSRANIRSVSGDLSYAGWLAKGGRYELKSHAGDITLAVPGNVGFELTANLYNSVKCTPIGR